MLAVLGYASWYNTSSCLIICVYPVAKKEGKWSSIYIICCFYHSFFSKFWYRCVCVCSTRLLSKDGSEDVSLTLLTRITAHSYESTGSDMYLLNQLNWKLTCIHFAPLQRISNFFAKSDIKQSQHYLGLLQLN